MKRVTRRPARRELASSLPTFASQAKNQSGRTDAARCKLTGWLAGWILHVSLAASRLHLHGGGAFSRAGSTNKSGPAAPQRVAACTRAPEEARRQVSQLATIQARGLPAKKENDNKKSNFYRIMLLIVVSGGIARG